MTQADKARLFAALHRPGEPLILFNAWDAGSARVVAEAGARAIATGSWSVAAAQGYDDSEALPLDLALANAARIAAAVDLPVTIDFEGAYAAAPDEAAANVARLAATGAIGCNFEDQAIGGEGLHPIEKQAARIRAIRAATGPDFFLNARTDLFLKAKKESHDAAMVDAALERARAFAGAGASGIFVPLLDDLSLLERFCAASPLPVNVMAHPGAPSAAEAARAGVARISHGPYPYRLALAALKQAAVQIYG
jgi:2-methylisocitrate lyase-like PEP mutase family enzyme